MRFRKDTFASITTGVKKQGRKGLQAAASGIGTLKDKVAANIKGFKNKLSKLT